MAKVARGFTLVEMMVVLSVLAIVMAFAMPAYSNFVAKNKVNALASTLLADLNNARMEAIRQGARMTVCASSDYASCNASQWGQGWVVRSVASVVTVRQVTDVITASSALTSLTFLPSGRVASSGMVSFFGSGTPPASATVVVEAYGLVSLNCADSSQVSRGC